MLLRLGAAQLFHLDTPGFAAVDMTVDMAGARKATQPFKGLVNAVLRGLLREPPRRSLRRKPTPRPGSTPAGAPPMARPAPTPSPPASPRSRPPTSVCAIRPMREALAQAVGRPPVAARRYAPHRQRRGDLADWPGFAEGRWWVQDAAAAIPARLLALKPGETALDLCAAPGGKTLQLAATGAIVTALDRSAARLKRLSENLTRVSAEGGSGRGRRRRPGPMHARLRRGACSTRPARPPAPSAVIQMCLWAAKPSDIAKLAAVQTALLDAAADRVKPGGRLVYCVCSLEPEEGEAQIDGVPDTAAPISRSIRLAPGEGGAPAAALTSEGDVAPVARAGGTGRGDGRFLRHPIAAARLMSGCSASVQARPATLAGDWPDRRGTPT